MGNITITKKELTALKKLIIDFNSYYKDDMEWNFRDLDDQREIAKEIVNILEYKL
jgi:cytochrome c oxidase assembly protein Cox11